MTKIISVVAIAVSVLVLSACSAKDTAVDGAKDTASAAVPSTGGLKDKAVDKAVAVADKKTDGKASQAIKLVK